jgi:surfeit locus 1 family protein
MRFRPNIWATVVVIPALAALIALGVWQLQRREWKHDLLARIAAERAAPPRDLADVLNGPEDQRAYAHVFVEGTISAAPTVQLFAPEGQGAANYRIIAPLHRDFQFSILVDLGSVTEAEKAKLGLAGVPPGARGVRRIEGILRPSETPGWMDAEPDLNNNRWYVRDVPRMAKTMAVSNPPPFILQSETPNAGGLPRPVPFQPELADNHLSYAVTWFSLALILVVIYVLFHLKRPDDRQTA